MVWVSCVSSVPVNRLQPRRHRRETACVLDAIRLYTTYSAYAEFVEASKGSLEPGKLADLIVLAKDPFDIPVDALKDVQVQTTIVGGRVVHEGVN